MSADDGHLLGPGLLPTPFSAAQIRDSSRGGKSIRLLVELDDGTSFERINRFRDGDADGATLEQWNVDSPDDVTVHRVTWRELQEHAAFPAGLTTETTEAITLPLGNLECLRYDLSASGDGQAMTFWFALVHPGMPVRYEAQTPDGVNRTTVISIEPTWCLPIPVVEEPEE